MSFIIGFIIGTMCGGLIVTLVVGASAMKERWIMKDKLQKITNYFGIKNQIIKLNEEVAELTYACVENEETRDEYFEITEEMADVMVLLKQLQIRYEIDDAEIEAVMKEKVDRTLTRIREGYYDKHR